MPDLFIRQSDVWSVLSPAGKVVATFPTQEEAEQLRNLMGRGFTICFDPGDDDPATGD